MNSAWFVTHTTGSELEYDISPSQLNQLQLQSDLATQTVIFSCLNVQTYGFQFLPNDDDGRDYINTSANQFRHLTKIEKQEGCQVNNQWGKSIYKLSTRRPHVLPIYDVLVYDVGGENQKLGISIGEICFRPEVRK